MVPGWNPHAMCDGSRAQDRAEWLMKNEGMSAMFAQQKIMSEFPNQFQNFGGMMPGGSAPNWNPNVMCDGSRAEARVDWLVKNQGMTPFAAQQKIMSEFPAQFGMGSMGMGGMGMGGLGGMGGMGMGMSGMWNPNAMCDGSRAEERANWLHQNQGLTLDAARQKVMSEFPQQFGGCGGMGMGGMGMGGMGGMGGMCMGGMGGMWNPNAMCDGSRAEDRANWLRDNKGMNIDMARQQIMQEFTGMFGGGGFGGGKMFNPNAFCDGVRAEERVLWLQQNKGMNVDMARQQVMREFPGSF